MQDDDILWLSKKILKGSGKRGLPQGSVIGPLWANVYLNEVDRILERAQEVTKQGAYESVRYTRFADMVILVSNHPRARHWASKVELRLREELAKLDLSTNDEKTKTVDFGAGEAFDFLGYTFRWVPSRSNPKKKMVLATPQREKQTQFLRNLKDKLRRCLHVPVETVIRRVVNPRVRGWVNYFRWGNSGAALVFVRWQVELKIRRFASRQRPKRRGGRTVGWQRRMVEISLSGVSGGRRKRVRKGTAPALHPGDRSGDRLERGCETSESPTVTPTPTLCRLRRAVAVLCRKTGTGAR